MNWLEEWIRSTHKVVEDRPEPYGFFHIAFVILSLALILAICYFARKSSDTAFRAVLFSVGMVLLVSEVYKQLYYAYVLGQEGYDWYIFPFQLCSIPMYLSILVGCMKKNRFRDALCEYLASIGLLGGLMAYIEPSGILNGTYFTLIHSCLWHALLIFVGLYILFTGRACHTVRAYQKALWVLLGVVGSATVLNILFRHRPDFNMCYISPFYNTPLAVFSSFDRIFQDMLGQYPGRILSILLYIIALALGGFILYLAACVVKKASGPRKKI